MVIRVLERNLAKLGILPDNQPGEFVDPLELLDSLYDDFRVVICVLVCFPSFGENGGLEPEWRVWMGNAVWESRSACRSSESARLGLHDLAQVITRLFFCRIFSLDV